MSKPRDQWPWRKEKTQPAPWRPSPEDDPAPDERVGKKSPTRIRHTGFGTPGRRQVARTARTGYSSVRRKQGSSATWLVVTPSHGTRLTLRRRGLSVRDLVIQLWNNASEGTVFSGQAFYWGRLDESPARRAAEAGMWGGVQQTALVIKIDARDYVQSVHVASRLRNTGLRVKHFSA